MTSVTVVSATVTEVFLRVRKTDLPYDGSGLVLQRNTGILIWKSEEFHYGEPCLSSLDFDEGSSINSRAGRRLEGSIVLHRMKLFAGFFTDLDNCRGAD